MFAPSSLSTLSTLSTLSSNTTTFIASSYLHTAITHAFETIPKFILIDNLGGDLSMNCDYSIIHH